MVEQLLKKNKTEKHLTKVPAGRLVGGLCLNRSDSGFGLFVLVWIVPIPQRTLNIKQHLYALEYSASLYK